MRERSRPAEAGGTAAGGGRNLGGEEAAGSRRIASYPGLHVNGRETRTDPTAVYFNLWRSDGYRVNWRHGPAVSMWNEPRFRIVKMPS
jgi:hypothetical protein